MGAPMAETEASAQRLNLMGTGDRSHTADSRLIALVKLLARRAAQSDYEQERERALVDPFGQGESS
jgi:hypothetical protein